jgi:hypothetical protein
MASAIFSCFANFPPAGGRNAVITARYEKNPLCRYPLSPTQLFSEKSKGLSKKCHVTICRFPGRALKSS